MTCGFAPQKNSQEKKCAKLNFQPTFTPLRRYNSINPFPFKPYSLGSEPSHFMSQLQQKDHRSSHILITSRHNLDLRITPFDIVTWHSVSPFQYSVTFMWTKNFKPSRYSRNGQLGLPPLSKILVNIKEYYDNHFEYQCLDST